MGDRTFHSAESPILGGVWRSGLSLHKNGLALRKDQPVIHLRRVLRRPIETARLVVMCEPEAENAVSHDHTAFLKPALSASFACITGFTGADFGKEKSEHARPHEGTTERLEKSHRFDSRKSGAARLGVCEFNHRATVADSIVASDCGSACVRRCIG